MPYFAASALATGKSEGSMCTCSCELRNLTRNPLSRQRSICARHSSRTSSILIAPERIAMAMEIFPGKRPDDRDSAFLMSLVSGIRR